MHSSAKEQLNCLAIATDIWIACWANKDFYLLCKYSLTNGLDMVVTFMKSSTSNPKKAIMYTLTSSKVESGNLSQSSL